MKSLENHRVLYDSMALWIAIFPLLLYPFLIITAPLAIFVAVRYWHRPSSIIPRTNIRKILAIFLGLIELFIVGFFAYFLLSLR